MNNINLFHVVGIPLLFVLGVAISAVLFAGALVLFTKFALYLRERYVKTSYTLLTNVEAETTVVRLQNAYGLKSKAETYDLAIRVLEWVAVQQSQNIPVGRRRDDTGFEPLEVLGNQPVKKKTSDQAHLH